MEPAEHFGIWWDPQNPDEEWAGTLRCDDKGRASLAVTVAADKPSPFPTLRSYKRIQGVASSGKHFTLIDCWDSSTRGSFFIAPRPSEIHANLLIAGIHCDDEDPPLSSVTVRFANAHEWLGRSGFEYDSTLPVSDFAARYRGSLPVVVYDSGETRVSIRASLERSHSASETTMRERVAFDIESTTPRPLSHFQRLVRCCGAFLSVAYSAYCSIDEFTIFPPAEAGALAKIATLHVVPRYKIAAEISRTDMLFRFSDFEKRAPDLFGAWLSKLDQMEDAVSLYIEGVYGRGFIEHRLVALVQGAEALHRQFMPDRYMKQDDFDNQVFLPMTGAIPASVGASHRAAITSRLEFANEYSQRRRLRELFKAHASVLGLLVRDPLALVSPIVDTRNEFTHFPVPADVSHRHSVRPNTERALLYNWTLRLLLESCFLTEMGFSVSEIESFVGRSDTYRQMGQRFSGLGTAS